MTKPTKTFFKIVLHKGLLISAILCQTIPIDDQILIEDDIVKYPIIYQNNLHLMTEKPILIQKSYPQANVNFTGKVWNVFDDTAPPRSIELFLNGSQVTLDNNFEFTLSQITTGIHEFTINDPTRSLWNYEHEFELISDTSYTFKLLPKKIDMEALLWARESYMSNGASTWALVQKRNFRWNLPIPIALDTTGTLSPYNPDKTAVDDHSLWQFREAMKYWEDMTGINLFEETSFSWPSIIFNVPLDSIPYGISVQWEEFTNPSAGTTVDETGNPYTSHLTFPFGDTEGKLNTGNIHSELHELGHALGFSHPEEGYNFAMSYNANEIPYNTLAIKEYQTIRAKYVIDKAIELKNYRYKYYYTTEENFSRNAYRVPGSNKKVTLDMISSEDPEILSYYQDGYLLNGTITVNHTDTLLIQGNKHIYFEPNTKIRVYGTLIIDGEKEKPIQFTSAQDPKGGGIFIIIGEKHRIKNAIINNLDIGLGYYFYRWDWVDKPDAYLELENVTINNSRYGLWNPDVAHGLKKEGTINIKDCIFSNNFVGVHVPFTDEFESKESIYSDNYVGLYLYYFDNSSLESNIFSGNSLGLSHFDNSRLFGIGSDTYLLNYPNTSHDYTITGTPIFTNINNNFENLDINISTTITNYNAENNYWGTIISNEIESKLNGEIDYTPFLTGPIVLSAEEQFTNIESFKLEQNYPNPFNPFTIINYTLPRESEVTINVYDMLGREVNNFHAGLKPSGSHSIQWNGTDTQGNLVPAGIYFYQLQAGDFVQTKKMVLMK